MCMCQCVYMQKPPAVHTHTLVKTSFIYGGIHYQEYERARTQPQAQNTDTPLGSCRLGGRGALKLSLSCLLLFESNPADTCFVAV